MQSRSIPQYVTAGLFLSALLSLFWLPWACTLLLAFACGLIFPPAAIMLGILADLVYYSGQGYLWATISGAVISLLCVLVRHIVKTRIM